MELCFESLRELVQTLSTMKKHVLNNAKLGDVWSISLRENMYGYARIFRGGCLGILPAVSKGIVRDVEQLKGQPAKWFFDFAAPPTDKTEVFRVGVMPFRSLDEAWPPPRYVPPDVFKGYFQIWEKGTCRPAEESETRSLQKSQMATPDWLRQFIINHCDQCVQLTIDEPSALPAAVKENEKLARPTLLEIVFRSTDSPFAGRDEVEDALSTALESAKAGEVTGGGTSPGSCSIDVAVFDPERGLKIIRHTLRRLGCPAATEIHQHEPQHLIHHL